MTTLYDRIVEAYADTRRELDLAKKKAEYDQTPAPAPEPRPVPQAVVPTPRPRQAPKSVPSGTTQPPPRNRLSLSNNPLSAIADVVYDVGMRGLQEVDERILTPLSVGVFTAATSPQDLPLVRGIRSGNLREELISIRGGPEIARARHENVERFRQQHIAVQILSDPLLLTGVPGLARGLARGGAGLVARTARIGARPVEAAGPSRAPWQMTRAEFQAEVTANAIAETEIELAVLRRTTAKNLIDKGQIGPFSRHKTKAAGIRNLEADIAIFREKGANADHYGYVARAVHEGQPVPAKVLQEYPDFVQALPAQVPPQPALSAASRPVAGPETLRSSQTMININNQGSIPMAEYAARRAEAARPPRAPWQLGEEGVFFGVPSPRLLPSKSRPVGRPEFIPPTRPPVPPRFPTGPTPPGVPTGPTPLTPGSIMGDISGADEVVQIMTRPDIWRKIANQPGMRSIMGRMGPAAVANTPATQFVVGRAMLRDQGQQLSQVAMARLNSLGTQEQVFGALTREGLIAEGPLRGLTVNTIRAFPKRYASKLTSTQTEWIAEASRVQRASLDYLTNNGISIKLLTFEEGGEYAGRRVVGKFTAAGEFLEVNYIGAGPGLPGAKLAGEKIRVFETMEEAISKGFRYLSDDEALFLNVQGAYNRVADKRMADWLIESVPWRSMATPEAAKIAREAAQRRLAYAKRSIDALQRAIRGESLPTGTVNAIERLFPQLEGRLREPTKILVADVLKAAKTLAEPERVLEVPKLGAITKVQKLLTSAEEQLALNPGNATLQREVSKLRSSLGFIRYRIGVGEPITLPHQPVKELRKGAIDDLRELLDTIRGTRTMVPGRKTPRFSGGLIEDIRLEVHSALQMSKRAGEQARSLRLGEAQIKAPAFQGKIFTGPNAEETARVLRESMEPGFSKALDAVNKANAVGRYFQLAGDMSPMTIQLLYMMGAHPKVYAKAGAGFVRALANTRFQARYLARPENAAIIQKYPETLLTRGGTSSEFTEAMSRGGLLRKGPLKIAGVVLEPFQRGFEGALDVAGIEMLKSLDRYGTTAARRSDLAQFVNEFRGLTSSARLGVSIGQRQIETAALLAPRYNRAIMALLFDTMHGGLRGHLARKSLAQGVTAITAMGVFISYAMGESPKEIAAHLNPSSPKFMTWQLMGQNIGPGTKLRSVISLFARSAKNPELLEDTAFGFGDLDYIKNPVIKFGRAQTSPVLSTGWDLLSGRDFIGEPSRDGLVSFTNTVGENFMPIWVQSVALEGGTIQERATRGAAEFSGLRAYPRNRLREARTEWQSDIDTYLSISTDPLEREANRVRVDRTTFRTQNPTIDAKLFITGQVTSLKTIRAASIVRWLVDNQNINPTEIRAVQSYQEKRKQRQDLGLPRYADRRTDNQKTVDRTIEFLLADASVSQGAAPDSALTPEELEIRTQKQQAERQADIDAIPLAPGVAARSGATRTPWQDISNLMDSTQLRALSKVWQGGALSDMSAQTTRRLQTLYQRHPMGAPNFTAWVKQTLRQVQSNHANSRQPVVR